MLPIRAAFASFSTDDTAKAREFYERLGLEVRDTPMGVIEVMIGADQHVTIYPKPNHEPASFTVLNFVVPSIDEAVDDLKSMGIEMQHYDMPGIQQDARGIAREPQGPAIAWFLDNARNTLAVIEDSSVGD